MDLGKSIARNENLPVRLRRLGMIGSALARSRSRFIWRYRALRYAVPPQPSRSSVGALGPIWFFWAQGVEQAPPVVRASIASIKRFAAGRDVCVLTADNVGDYVALPDVFERKRSEISWAHYADALRLALLVKHGGTWFDSTILQVAPMPESILNHDAVIPGQPAEDRVVGNWFLHGKAGHPLLTAWLDALTAYRELDARSRPYFHMHYLMEGMVIYDAHCEDMLKAAVKPLDANPPLEIVRSARRVGEASPWDELVQKSWMHKLSYKPPGAEPILHWLERSGLIPG